MRVLHITPYYAPAWSYGGVVRAVTGLTRAQTEAGHTAIVLTTDTLAPSQRSPVRKETIDGVLVIRVRNLSNSIRGGLNLSTPVRFGAAARQIILEHGIDLVHCHELRTVENLSVARAAGSLGRPMVVSPHGTIPYAVGRRRLKQLWDRAFGKFLLPCFDRVITLTKTEAVDARALWAGCGVPLHDDQVAIIPNAIFPDEFARLPSGELFRRQLGLGDGPIVLFLGRLAERKGLQLLIPAFAEASRDAPDARLLIVGPDDHMRSGLAAQNEKLHLTRRVCFTGLLAGDDRRSALAASDIFALPAVGEGFSMAALEAMACSLPIVITADCSFPEIVEAGAGLVVSREVDALSQALRTLLLDPGRRAAMGKRARKLVHEHYLWPQVVARLGGIYETAVRDHARGPQESPRDTNS